MELEEIYKEYPALEYMNDEAVGELAIETFDHDEDLHDACEKVLELRNI